MTSTSFKHCVRPLCVITLLLTAALLAACGSSSPSSSSTPSPTASAARDATLGVAHTVAVRSRVHRTTQAHPDPVTDGVITHKPRHGTGAGEINDDNPGRADSGNQSVAGGGNPCNLVSRAQAQAILGRAVGAPVEAPLGPTCIYRPVGAKRLVTLAVESISFATIRAHIRDRTELHVGGRTAYCGNYGQPTVFVPLASGRVLTVTASCAVGAKFAAQAIPRITLER